MQKTTETHTHKAPQASNNKKNLQMSSIYNAITSKKDNTIKVLKGSYISDLEYTLYINKLCKIII